MGNHNQVGVQAVRERPGLLASQVLCALLTGSYLLGHIWLFWKRPGRFLEFEIGLQFLVLAALFIAIRYRQRNAGGVPLQIPRRLLIAGVLLFLVGGLAANRIVTAGRLISDESAYRFQSRILAAGHLKAPPPPPAVFYEHHIIDSRGWFTKFPPGWPVVLAASSKAGLGWAVNILLGAVLLAIVFAIGRRVYAEQEARMALFLLLLSPVFFGNCLGQMSHPLCGTLLAGAAWFYFRARRDGPLWNAAVMLGAIVVAIMVRPLTGALFGVVLGVALLWDARYDRRRLAARAALCALFALAAIALASFYNYEMTGSFTEFPYAEFSRTSIPVELTPDANTGVRILRWSLVSVWAFAFPLLFPMAALTLFCDRQKRAEAVVLSALFLCLVAGYAPNRYTSGSFLGERFYFEGLFAVALLAARGLTLLQQRWKGLSIARWYLAPLAAAALATVGFSLPVVFQEVRPYAQVRRLAESLPLRNAVVFLQSHDPEFIAKHFNLNQADWPAAPVFYAPDPGPEKRQALADALGRTTQVVITYDPLLKNARLAQFWGGDAYRLGIRNAR